MTPYEREAEHLKAVRYGITKGTRKPDALVYDWSLFVDDKTTPLDVTMQPATILRRYKLPDGRDAVDVVFHHDMRRSNGHFTWSIEELAA